jgi:very-short-patch-repair endonuclease
MAGTDAEAAIARLAARRQGMVTTAQRFEAGFSEGAIRRRVAGGWLVRRHRGVYQVGVFGGPFGAEMAALLACGPRAVLSHETAAVMWRLFERVASAPVHVSVIGALAGRRPGIRAHRADGLAEEDIVRRNRLRVTTPARTLLDLASSMPTRDLDRLVEEAQVRKLVTRAGIIETLHRGAGRAGVANLRAVVGPDDEPAFTRSEAERRLVELVRAAGLPAPRTNTRVAGLEVDALWADERLVVEVDGFQYHRTRAVFERDRHRDGRLLVAGYRVLRITWRQLTRERERVVALLAAVLRP